MSAARIRDLSDYIDACRALNRSKLADNVLFYRGINQEFEFCHIPSLYYDDKAKFYINEHKILGEAISMFPDELLAQKTTVEKLILMQHYNLPTRIMDISKNALISLFFACFADKGQETSKTEDGIVYVYEVPEYQISFCDSDTVAIIANIAKRTDSFSFKRYSPGDWKKFNEQDEILHLLHEIRQEKPDFAPIIDGYDEINSVVCLRPRLNNPRIIRQDGYFFLFGVDGEKKNCAKMPQEWIKDELIIPADYKKAILEELDTMNINEGFVYPDFEHVNTVIRRRYGKANQMSAP
jgi:hypothetical protein